MATLKIKFRPSSVPTKEGTLYFQIIHNRLTRQIKTNYKLFPYEWNNRTCTIILPIAGEERKKQLLALHEQLTIDVEKLQKLIGILEQRKASYTCDDLIAAFKTPTSKTLFLAFMEHTVNRVKQLGKARTSETYSTTLNSFRKFRQGEEIPIYEIDSDLLITYESWLKTQGVSMNTISFYMRVLRAVYNRAVEEGLTPQRRPFRHVYTGVDKTVKRAVSLKVIKQIKAMDLSRSPSLDYVRDMFLFSFYTRGMAFVDMAYLKKKDLNRGTLSYRRKKTGQPLFIRWEKCMQEIINKYSIADTPYLLPIIKYSGGNERGQYLNASHFINRKLKVIGERLRLSTPLTMYVARHAWASIAKNKKIPVSVISESMGHDSETTTQIYLASLDTVIVDKANKLILGCL